MPSDVTSDVSGLVFFCNRYWSWSVELCNYVQKPAQIFSKSFMSVSTSSSLFFMLQTFSLVFLCICGYVLYNFEKMFST